MFMKKIEKKNLKKIHQYENHIKNALNKSNKKLIEFISN